MKSFGSIRTRNNKTGFTITEVIVASLIFVLVIIGVFSTISSLSEPSEESTREVTAALIGKQILENLRLAVDARFWDSGDSYSLSPTGGPLSDGVYPLDEVIINYGSYNETYFPTYQVIDDPYGSQARQVTVNVTW